MEKNSIHFFQSSLLVCYDVDFYAGVYISRFIADGWYTAKNDKSNTVLHSGK